MPRHGLIFVFRKCFSYQEAHYKLSADLIQFNSFAEEACFIMQQKQITELPNGDRELFCRDITLYEV